jgi:cyclopropane fatty-acyl-phospholipid synthase-like methyltransferase
MSADAIHSRMLSETVDGVSLNNLVGGGDPKAVSDISLEILTRHNLVKPGARVFEIGCGCGRMALPLAEYGQGVRYTGIDIIPGLVSFCRREISSRYPNFSFYTIKEGNPQYDKYIAAGNEDLAGGDFETMNGSYDLVVAFSVFTHLARAETEAMLKTVWRRLASGGSAVLTFFLLDPVSRAQIRARKANLFRTAKDVDQPLIFDSFNGANSAVGYDHNVLMEMVRAAGFEGLYALQYGSWRFTPGFHYQDIVILKKEEPIPADFDSAAYLAAHPDVKAAGMDAAFHYRNWGRTEGRRLR